MFQPTKAPSIGLPIRYLALILCAAAGLLLTPREAAAYLDPGTGSAVIQMVVAVVMGGLFVVKMYWRKLVSLVSGKPMADEGEAPEGSPPDDGCE